MLAATVLLLLVFSLKSSCSKVETVPNFPSSRSQNPQIEGAIAKCPFPYVKVGDICLYAVCDTSNPMNWLSARSFCQTMVGGGDLAILKDGCQFADAINYVRSFKDPQTCNFWIGGSDATEEGIWRWLDGDFMKLGSPFWGQNVRGTGLAPEVSTNELDYAYLNKYDNYLLKDGISGGVLESGPLCQITPKYIPYPTPPPPNYPYPYPYPGQTYPYPPYPYTTTTKPWYKPPQQGYGSNSYHKNPYENLYGGSSYSEREQENRSKPNQQFHSGSVKQEFHSSPVRHDFQPNPVRQEFHPNPVRQEFHSNPVREDFQSNPIRKEFHPDSLKQEFHTNPIRQEFHSNPVRKEFHSNPVRQEFHPPPLTRPEIHSNPVRQELHSNSVRPEFHPIPASHDFHSKPISGKHQKSEHQKEEETRPEPDKHSGIFSDKAPESGHEILPNNFEGLDEGHHGNVGGHNKIYRKEIPNTKQDNANGQDSEKEEQEQEEEQQDDQQQHTEKQEQSTEAQEQNTEEKQTGGEEPLEDIQSRKDKPDQVTTETETKPTEGARLFRNTRLGSTSPFDPPRKKISPNQKNILDRMLPRMMFELSKALHTINVNK